MGGWTACPQDAPTSHKNAPMCKTLRTLDQLMSKFPPEAGGGGEGNITYWGEVNITKCVKQNHYQYSLINSFQVATKTHTERDTTNRYTYVQVPWRMPQMHKNTANKKTLDKLMSKFVCLPLELAQRMVTQTLCLYPLLCPIFCMCMCTHITVDPFP